MTMPKLTAIAGALVVALAFANASAQQSKTPQGAESTQMPAAMSTAEAQAKIAERFKAADANHDGKLTREESEAGMPGVYKHFDKIDRKKQGFVTEKQVGAYWGAMKKEQMQKENPLWFGS
ncbi:EF-hand domain-containing protein [Cupriavidus basilensis]